MKIFLSLSRELDEGIKSKIKNYLKNKNFEIISFNNRDGQNNWGEIVNSSDAALIEGSSSSINKGFEVSELLKRGKIVILLYHSDLEPELLHVISDTYLIDSEYEEDNLDEVLDWCFEEVQRLSNKRFTFYISPEIDNFLETVSNEEDISKSEYIRNLIEKEIINKS